MGIVNENTFNWYLTAYYGWLTFVNHLAELAAEQFLLKAQGDDWLSLTVSEEASSGDIPGAGVLCSVRWLTQTGTRW